MVLNPVNQLTLRECSKSSANLWATMRKDSEGGKRRCIAMREEEEEVSECRREVAM
jgi:hypothetical protein